MSYDHPEYFYNDYTFTANIDDYEGDDVIGEILGPKGQTLSVIHDRSRTKLGFASGKKQASRVTRFFNPRA